MRRSLLLTTSVLGLLICLIGGTGLFAALTDSAHTGTNTVDSAALPNSADLQLATATNDGTEFTCGTFSDDLATGLFSSSDLTPGSGPNPAYLCIRNAGSAPVAVTAVVDQLTDVDIACTGDEADYGDTTCGNDAAGELADVLKTAMFEADCLTDNPIMALDYTPLTSAQTPGSLGTLGAGQTKCYFVQLFLPTDPDTTAEQLAQSDQVTWRYVFSGQAS